jgi:hypothetical protein
VTIRRIAAVLSLVVLAADAFAQDRPDAPFDAQQPAAAQGDQSRRKEPPPPLFPRHGRGIYRNAHGDEVIDATPQSPPLVTDDPSVPNEGRYEVNVLSGVDVTKSTRRADLLVVDANYGLRPAVAGYHLPMQIKLAVPLAGARQSGEPFEAGFGTAEAGVKFNFYDDERRGITVSVYPQLEFPTPGARGVAKGLAEKGETIVLPLLVEREFHEFTFVFNAALNTPLHDPERKATSDFGAAFGRALTRKDATMVELRTASSLDFRSERLVFLNLGYVHGVRHIVMYGNVGHSVFADDGAGHLYAGVGIKLQVDTKQD